SSPYAAGVVGAVPLMLVNLLFGAQHGFPRSLNVPPVAVVFTHTEYLVRVLIEQAVTGAQLHLVNGYCCVPSPTVTTTGELIVVVAGIVCATIMQIFSPSL